MTRVEDFHQSLDRIPKYPISIDCIMLNMHAFSQSISNMPKTVMNNINEIIIKFLQNESTTLYTELMDYIQIFSTETSELTQYIEQTNAYRKLKNEFQSLEKKVENLEAVASILHPDILHQIPASPNAQVAVSSTIGEVRKCLSLLPDIFRKIGAELDYGRDNLSIKVLETSSALFQMSNDFKAAYIENLHKKASTKKPKEIYNTVLAKTKSFEDIEKKATLFKQALEFLKNEGDRRVSEAYPDLDNFE